MLLSKVLPNIKKEYNHIIVDNFKLDEQNNIEGFVARRDQHLEGLQTRVNNAGITLDNLSIRLSSENWKKVLDINITSTFLMCKFAIKKMLKKL